MKKFLRALLLVGIVSCGQQAIADNLKMGVVDLQKIVQTSSHIQVIQKNLEQKFRTRHDALMNTEKDLKAKIEAFKRDAAVMNPTAKKETERSIVAMQQKFEMDGQQYQRELSTAHNEAMEDFYTKVRAAIATVAKKEHFDLILQKDAAPFSSEKLDVTKQVIEAIH